MFLDFEISMAFRLTLLGIYWRKRAILRQRSRSRYRNIARHLPGPVRTPLFHGEVSLSLTKAAPVG